MQFIIQEKDLTKKKEFYNYIRKKYKLKKHLYNKIKTHYPIVIDFDEKSIWICTSITCCSLAAQNKQIISIEEFNKIMKEGI